MRQRLIKDTVLNNTLLVTGDKVFVQQVEGSPDFVLYSFFTRAILGLITKIWKEEFLGPEENSPMKGNVKGKVFPDGKYSPGKDRQRYVPIILMLLMPLWGNAQRMPVTTNVAAVKVAADVYEIQVHFEIQPDWWIYGPNKPSKCDTPTKIWIEPDPMVDQLDVFEPVMFHNADFDPACHADRYYIQLSALAPFKLLKRGVTNLNVHVTFTPYSKYGPHLQQEYVVTVPLRRGVPERDTIAVTLIEDVITRNVPDLCGRVWWCLKHPFSKPYWKL